MNPPKPTTPPRRSRIVIDDQEQNEFEKEMKEQIIKMFEDFEKETPKKPLKGNKKIS